MTCPILPVGPVRVVYCTAWTACGSGIRINGKETPGFYGVRRNYATEVVVRYRRSLRDLGPW